MKHEKGPQVDPRVRKKPLTGTSHSSQKRTPAADDSPEHPHHCYYKTTE